MRLSKFSKVSRCTKAKTATRLFGRSQGPLGRVRLHLCNVVEKPDTVQKEQQKQQGASFTSSNVALRGWANKLSKSFGTFGHPPLDPPRREEPSPAPAASDQSRLIIKQLVRDVAELAAMAETSALAAEQAKAAVHGYFPKIAEVDTSLATRATAATVAGVGRSLAVPIPKPVIYKAPAVLEPAARPREQQHDHKPSREKLHEPAPQKEKQHPHKPQWEKLPEQHHEMKPQWEKHRPPHDKRQEKRQDAEGPQREAKANYPMPYGTGYEILLQGFHWDSHKQNWYQKLNKEAAWIAQLGFTLIWMPPPTDSVSAEGYMPRDLYNLNSAYGSADALKGCIATLKAAGLRPLADAVLNHRCASHQGPEGLWNKYGGKLAWDSSAIVSCHKEYRGRGNKKQGDMYDAAPNIDHTQPFVRRDLSEWMLWLRQDIGFEGFRLDFVRGYAGGAVKEYVEASNPHFVVGEYWDSLQYEGGYLASNQDGHRQRIVNWINQAGGRATAFDMTLKGILHAVFERNEYWRLKDHSGKPCGVLGWWPSRTVTFLENHDTGSTQGHWRFPHHGLEQGYAYILTHPGTPTVFYDHLHDRHLQSVISRLVALRKRMKLHVQSSVKILRADHTAYAAEIDGKIVMKIGPGDFFPGSGWRKAEAGGNWCVWEADA